MNATTSKRARIALAAAATIALASPTLARVDAAPNPTMWVSSLPAAEGQDHLSGFANGVVYAQWGNGVARSTDGGLTFSQLPTSPPGVTGTSGIVRFATPTLGYAIGDGLPRPCALPTKGVGAFSLYVTKDSGGTWTPACPPLIPLSQHGWFAPAPTGLYASRDGKTVWVAGQWQPDSCQSLNDEHGMIFVTSDGGAHWTTFTLPGGVVPPWETGGIRDATHWLVITGKLQGSCTGGSEVSGGEIYLTTDGKHLRPAFKCPASSSCSAAAFVSASRVIVGLADGRTFVSPRATSFSAGQTLRSTSYQRLIDSGQLNPNYFWIQAFSFANDRVGYASTRGSGTWRTTNGGVSWQQETSPECAYYPFGVGDIAAAGIDNGVTGGPRNIDARIPGTASLGCASGTNPQAIAAAVSTAHIGASWTSGTMHITIGPTGTVTYYAGATTSGNRNG